jgi:hypothetical protein
VNGPETFVIDKWSTRQTLAAHYVQVIFCIYHADTTFVLKRRVIYVGPKTGTQLEGQPAIGSHEERLGLEGTPSLPWIDVAGLLAAPGDLAQYFET